MAYQNYNNNGNRNHNGNYSGGYNSNHAGNKAQGNQGYQGYKNNNIPKEILPETVPENYVDEAERHIKELSKGKTITTSKIRNLLSLISDIYNSEKLRMKENEVSEESAAKIEMMRVRTAYEAGRDGDVKKFVEETKLLQYLKGISKNRENLLRFAHYMEALVAYHRYYGGKD